ncbi:hypothetical protein Ciccas_013025, partial [Cichlidogyrus casuarinus]
FLVDQEKGQDDLSQQLKTYDYHAKRARSRKRSCPAPTTTREPSPDLISLNPRGSSSVGLCLMCQADIGHGLPKSVFWDDYVALLERSKTSSRLGAALVKTFLRGNPG